MKPVEQVYDVVASVAIGIPAYHLVSRENDASCEISVLQGGSDACGPDAVAGLVAGWLAALRSRCLAMMAWPVR